MMKLLTTSPRTTVWGLVSALGAFLSLALFEIPGAEEALADAAVWVRIAGGFLVVLGVWGIGHDARDNTVSSEEARAK